MVIWVIFAAITTATAALLLHPLATGTPGPRGKQASASLVYRDQLIELEREAQTGQLGAAEFEYARAEAARRLIKACDAVDLPVVVPSTHNIMRLAITAFVPLLSIALYVGLGSPDRPSEPLRSRLENPADDLPILINKTERHLRLQPSDGGGWDVIAPMYLRLNRIADAESAYRNAIRLLGPTSVRFDGLAEALIRSSGGDVSDDARKALEQSLVINPENPRARFYLALAMEQKGRHSEAKDAFEAIVKGSPANAPWLPLVNDHIARNLKTSSIANGQFEQKVKAGQNADPVTQKQMIRNMVESLETKLAEHPDNLEGWMRLIRSYAVLNDKNRAEDALRRGLASLSSAGSGKDKELSAGALALGIFHRGLSK